MNYKIKCDGKIIAAFVNATDRDLCLGLLAETYEDATFEAAEATDGDPP